MGRAVGRGEECAAGVFEGQRELLRHSGLLWAPMAIMGHGCGMLNADSQTSS
jgi:hypothetical protein